MSTACRCCCCPATSSPTAGPTRCCSRSRISATARSRPTTASGRSRATSTASRGPSRSSPRCRAPCTVLTDPAECGPVTLALCQDVQAEAFDYPESFFAERVWTHAPRRARTRASSRRVAALLRRPKKPLIIAGGGVLYSEAERDADATSPRRTAFRSPRRRPASARLPHDHPLNMGAIGVTGTTRRQRARRARPTSCSRSARGCRISPPAPGRCSRTPATTIIGLNVAALRRRQARRAAAGRRRRVGLEALGAGARRLAARRDAWTEARRGEQGRAGTTPPTR